MPKRKSMKSISNSVVDLTSSQIVPLATSSPTDKGDPSDTLNVQELRVESEASRKRFKDSLEKRLEEREAELKNVVRKKKLSISDWSTPATIDDIKFIRKIYRERCKILKENLSNKENSTRNQVESTNREQEDNHSIGENVEADNFKENENPSTDVKPAINEEKSKKKLQFAVEKAEADDESVFRKPIGRSKRTTKTSFQASSAFQTPKNHMRRGGYNVAVVTPGPNIERPVSILRRPNPGEMAISMTGSPLLIASNNLPVHVPQISIPFPDGRVMTVLANDDLDPDMSIFGDIDSETKERLAILQELLAKKTKKTK